MHTSDIVRRAMDYMEELLDEPLDLSDIAKTAGVSVAHLYRVFYSLTGHPVKEYIRKRRTSEAAGLLRTTDMGAMDIAILCGFESYRAFLKAFKQYTGLTPIEYRDAESFFSFERLPLEDNGTSHEKQVSGQHAHSDIRIVRLPPRKGVGFLHVSEREDGLEEDALNRFRACLAARGQELCDMSVFGWNVELDEGMPLFGYQLLAPDIPFVPGGVAHPELRPVELQGGVYASCRARALSAEQIVEDWNRLYSGWLPGSRFEPGSDRLFEQYVFKGDQVMQVHLYLPVVRSRKTQPIEIVELKPVDVLAFRAEGPGSIIRADQAAVEWLKSSGWDGGDGFEVFMSWWKGAADDEPSACEVFIALPEGYTRSPADNDRLTRLDGGLYACLASEAGGTMSGVLAVLERWLEASADYSPDAGRSWFIHYLPRSNGPTQLSSSRSNAFCCVPITGPNG
ncbi:MULTISPECIES: helix-turn-helix domain-containing protein [Paenibacillus]|uniref:helix-turn-helix domain-containing protein n=1 Tax=Paenibacillus TaxID=44249 RepID=UPI0006879025|nr:helix-turn-helix domain-containing protein [Paenibacillus sp. IHBB 10380]